MSFIFVAKKLIVLLLLYWDTSSALSPSISMKSKLRQTPMSIVKPNLTSSEFPLESSASSSLNTVLQWKELEFLFPSEAAKNKAIADQSYIRGNSVPIDVGVHYGSKGRRIFVTIPRFGIGRPMTLTTVVMDRSGPGGPLLRPYPDYTWHENPTKCEGMVSVFRVAMDPCNHMWVLDSGKIGSVQHCPPQLLLFDLKTDSLIHRHRFQPPIYRQTSVFVTPVVDVRDKKCKNSFVYIADIGGFGLIVYDHARNISWRVDNKLFLPYPSSGTHRIAGEQFELMDGVLGLSLGPLIDNDRYLYFHALASLTENRVATSIIRNFTIFENNTKSSPLSFQVYTGKRLSQSPASVIDSSGIMYFGLGDEIALGCWNIDNPYGTPFVQIAIQDSTKLQFMSGIKVVTHQNVESLWMVTNRFQKFMSGTLNNSTVNYRILTGSVPEISKGCRRRYSGEVDTEKLFSLGENNPDDINFLNDYNHGVISIENLNDFRVINGHRIHKDILEKVIMDVKQHYEDKMIRQRQLDSDSKESLDTLSESREIYSHCCE